MHKLMLSWLAVGLILAAPVYAQIGGGASGGGGGGMGGGGHGGHGGGKSGGGQPTKKASTASTPAPSADKPTNQIEITGVVTALDPATSRVTINYDAVDELNWPRGTMPFPVSKDELLKGVKVGEKVRFKVEEHEIYEIKPF